MHVDADSFPYHLFSLLISISEADLVSFDLEMSGIPSKLQDKPALGYDRTSLEQRYVEAKISADRYQILQVGITCAKFDYTANAYVLRPYNINISPLLDEYIESKFEREIAFQSGACSFLLNNNFDLGAALATGVRYLSREEAKRAKQLAYDRIEKKTPFEDLPIREDDVESLDFVRRVRKAVTKWNRQTSSCVYISSNVGLNVPSERGALSRVERRLVYQLVRAEFPDLVAVLRGDSLQIKEYDHFRETEYMRRQKDRAKEQILQHTGFRWVFEALAKDGRIDKAEVLDILQTKTSLGTISDIHDIKCRLERALDNLKRKKPVLVGHNMFVDTVFFYRTFVGPLPVSPSMKHSLKPPITIETVRKGVGNFLSYTTYLNPCPKLKLPLSLTSLTKDTLQEFSNAFHEIFPRIVDTKYLATYAKGDLKSPNLREIADKLNSQELPKIITHAKYDLYDGNKAYHEAGYDALLTATIMLQIAAKLGIERENHLNRDNFTTVKSSSPAQWSSAKQFRNLIPSQVKNTKASTKPTKLPGYHLPSKNVFETLRNMHLDPDTEPESDLDVEASPRAASPLSPEKSPKRNSGGQARPPSWGSQPSVHQHDAPTWELQFEREPMELIPSFDDADFWGEFGNKLRFFGTNEAVLGLGKWK